MSDPRPFISLVIPAYNSSRTIGNCLAMLQRQTYPPELFEVIVVDDGSSDNTAEIARSKRAKVLVQSNQGAAVARNLGAKEARGELILFTDSDCAPQEDWIERMVEPFTDPEIVGAKGFYKTRQRETIARFAQVEYDVKCDMLKKDRYIDFVDTYSAAYRRDIFLKVGGFDAIYTTASGEDSELSYKLALMGHKMVAAPDAFVFHQHPDTLFRYLKKKYRNAYWRVVTWKKYPSKMIKDSHTPNSYKVEIMLSPLLLFTAFVSFIWQPFLWVTVLLLMLFLLNEATFLKAVARTDARLLPLAPFYLYLRGLAVAAGVGAKVVEGLLGKLSREWIHSQRIGKRIMDVVLAALLILLSLPLWLIAALAIRLEDYGPVFYRRRVLGKDGIQLDAFKFRTMTVNADEVLRHNPELRCEFEKNFKIENDPRITRVGWLLRKTTIDEFPQLLNVLRGQMSLVGPRMISPAELSKYGEHAQKLLSVKPGMAGPWVAAGRQKIPYEQRVDMDLDYIDHWSMWLDIKILIKTAIAVIAMRGAY